MSTYDLLIDGNATVSNGSNPPTLDLQSDCVDAAEIRTSPYVLIGNGQYGGERQTYCDRAAPPATRAYTYILLAPWSDVSGQFPDIPELLVLHIRHVIVVRVLECFRDPTVVSLLVLAGADEAVKEREDYAHRGSDHLDS
jgi:hypothetical protein